MKYRKQQRLTIIHSLDEIPTFGNEDEEREWWATHDLSRELYSELEREPSPPGTVVFRLEKKEPTKARRRVS
jgi:hypothetical protein